MATDWLVWWLAVIGWWRGPGYNVRRPMGIPESLIGYEDVFRLGYKWSGEHQHDRDWPPTASDVIREVAQSLVDQAEGAGSQRCVARRRSCLS